MELLILTSRQMTWIIVHSKGGQPLHAPLMYRQLSVSIPFPRYRSVSTKRLICAPYLGCGHCRRSYSWGFSFPCLHRFHC